MSESGGATKRQENAGQRDMVVQVRLATLKNSLKKQFGKMVATEVYSYV